MPRRARLWMTMAMATLTLCACDDGASEGDGGVVLLTDGGAGGGAGAVDMAPPSGDSDIVAPVNADGVALTVTRAYGASEIARSGAGRGSIFVIVDLVISNGSDASIPTTFAQFRLGSSERLEFLASASSRSLDDACPEALLGAGGRLACSVAFEVAEDVEPVAIVYTTGLPDGAVEAEIADFEACARCGDACVDLSTNQLHCGACDSPVLLPGGMCVDGEPVCGNDRALCDDACVDLNSDVNHCGACERRCEIGCNDGECGVPAECEAIATRVAECAAMDPACANPPSREGLLQGVFCSLAPQLFGDVNDCDEIVSRLVSAGACE